MNLRILVATPLVALAACSDTDAQSPSANETVAETTEAVSPDTKEVVADPSEDASATLPDPALANASRSYDPALSAPQSATSVEFARVANAKLPRDRASSWRPSAPVEVTGPFGNLVLDEPPYAYVGFGNDPMNIHLYAEMDPAFARDQQYALDGFYDAKGNVTVNCMGAVSRDTADMPPVYKGCFALFRN
ncbi:MAG: hypothetical protein CVT85_12755 [Alphaproteobacteria bacterium HGW-Alphaproteobacteria-7]|jgi:hypothetical protein|nr:MAG: hypothetical protein CVT85_12755 [Alphaproteobacteria bacterium HGW-Alphaproteobacteria-7]